jgi:hypothetical protein
MTNQEDTKRIDSSSAKIEDQGDPSCGSEGGFFEIHVKGHLNSQWSDWLEGLEMKLLDNGEMILFGPIVDQAALMGVLNKLNRLNLTLLSVNKVNRKINKETN